SSSTWNLITMRSPGANFSPLSLTSVPPGPLSRFTNSDAGSANPPPGTRTVPVVVPEGDPVEPVRSHGAQATTSVISAAITVEPRRIGNQLTFFLLGWAGRPVRLVHVRHRTPTVARLPSRRYGS